MASIQNRDLGRLRELLLKYAGQMQAVGPSHSTIFKEERGKTDLETKVWHHLRKLEAAEYHYGRVVDLTTKVKEQLKRSTLRVIAGMDGTSEFRFTVRDQKILFEVDAFFAAVQSALDFLASVLSRYVKGKKTDEFDKLHKFLQHSDHTISALVHEAWVGWVQGSAYYRDYLLHRGVLPIPAASIVNVSVSNVSGPHLKELQELLRKDKDPVIFPLPKKPDPSIRLRSPDVLGLDTPEIPEGIIEVRTEVTVSTSGSDSGPKVSVSLGRTVGSLSFDAKSEISIGGQSNRIIVISHELAPGYVEAETLCRDLFQKLTNLSVDVFSELTTAGFTHIV